VAFCILVSSASRAATSTVYNAAEELREQVMDADTERAIIESIKEQAEKEEQEDRANRLMQYHERLNMKQVTKGVKRMSVKPSGYEADSSDEAGSGTERDITRLAREWGDLNVETDGEESEEERRTEAGGSESGESFLLVEEDVWDMEGEFESAEEEERPANPRAISRAAEVAEVSGNESWSEVEMTEDEDD